MAQYVDGMSQVARLPALARPNLWLSPVLDGALELSRSRDCSDRIIPPYLTIHQAGDLGHGSCEECLKCSEAGVERRAAGQCERKRGDDDDQ